MTLTPEDEKRIKWSIEEELNRLQKKAADRNRKAILFMILGIMVLWVLSIWIKSIM